MLLGLNELKYCLPMYDYMFLFMNFALHEHPLAHCQLTQSKLLLPYQRLTALVIRSVKSFLVNNYVPVCARCTQNDAIHTACNLPDQFATGVRTTGVRIAFGPYQRERR
jgi:hypothetical protein